jgi:hypothetical protein
LTVIYDLIIKDVKLFIISITLALENYLIINDYEKMNRYEMYFVFLVLKRGYVLVQIVSKISKITHHITSFCEFLLQNFAPICLDTVLCGVTIYCTHQSGYTKFNKIAQQHQSIINTQQKISCAQRSTLQKDKFKRIQIKRKKLRQRRKIQFKKWVKNQ